MQRWRTLSTLVVVGLAAACLPGAGAPLGSYGDDAGPPASTLLGDDGGPRYDVDLGDPFAIIGLQPSHGPWSGGTRATVAGRGFSSKLRVWVGATELDPSAIFASDPTRASIVTPAGSTGPADVRVRNVTTAEERTLPAGFFYDSFVARPGGGATTGGTRIALVGSTTAWTGASVVAVGAHACAGVAFTDPTHLSCTTPASAPGVQDITVTNADGSVDQARDAFTYSDSPDGYRGGLYGGMLAGHLDVLAFDSRVGTPLGGAKAIAGSNVATALIATMSAAGVALLTDPSLTGKVTVTVAAKCHHPITFVDVPVDTVTAYLEPELDPSCAKGDPPSGGNFNAVDVGTISGELVWPAVGEFQRGPWANVPQPIGPSERRAAYVWTAAGSPLDFFALPSPSSATTPDSGGQIGYAYSLNATPGNRTVYALAGLEDTSVGPPRFQPYVMGVARGVPVLPTVTIVNVDIPMSTLLDHALTTVPKPPPPTQLGLDRLVSTIAIDLGPKLFATLPQGTQTSLLPVAGSIAFVGVPSLDGTLAGASYNLTEQAVTGASHDLPRSVVTNIETTDANDPLTIGGFFTVPILTQPSAGAWTGTHVEVQARGAIDLIVLDVSSGGGLIKWRIVAPGNDVSFDVPDLSRVPGVGRLLSGPITAAISIAGLSSFDYGQLRYGQFSSTAWNTYAQSTVSGSY